MKVRSLTLAAMLCACGTNNQAQKNDSVQTKVEDKMPVAAADAAKPASMPKSILIRVKEDGKGDVLNGRENVEIRAIDASADQVNQENVFNSFEVDGKEINIADSSDSLDGDSSEGQCYWRGGYYRGGYGYGYGYNSCRPYYWGNYGYQNYSPYYSYSGYGYGYGYRNCYSYGGYRYYSYGW